MLTRFEKKGKETYSQIGDGIQPFQFKITSPVSGDVPRWELGHGSLEPFVELAELRCTNNYLNGKRRRDTERGLKPFAAIAQKIQN